MTAREIAKEMSVHIQTVKRSCRAVMARHGEAATRGSPKGEFLGAKEFNYSAERTQEIKADVRARARRLQPRKLTPSVQSQRMGWYDDWFQRLNGLPADWMQISAIIGLINVTRDPAFLQSPLHGVRVGDRILVLIHSVIGDETLLDPFGAWLAQAGFKADDSP